MALSEYEKMSSAKGRKRTDKSLMVERAKTDESLLEKGDMAERRADHAVSKNRAAADESKTVARLDTDDTHNVDERLRQERRNADAALESERRQMDSVLQRERKEKKAVQDKLFLNERKETDTNLTDERDQTDKENLQAVGALREEKASHVATQAALTTRDEFLAIVSHDLRNPLGVISMAADLLSERITSTADQETKEYLHLIERNANEAIRLIGDLMDMEQIAAGKLGLQIGRYDLGKLVQNAAKSAQMLVVAKNLALQVQALNEPIFVDCDQDRILQVLSNLLGNAVKFTPSGGTITLAIKSTQSEAQISIIDTGLGVPKDMQKIIFDRFWQIGKRDRRGLGLGLYISKMIIDALGGFIWIDSEAGEGSTFHFTLPLSNRHTTLGSGPSK